MRKFYKTTSFFIITFLFLFTSCHKQDNKIDDVEIEPIKYKKQKRNPNVKHKKGIEEMANYQLAIRKTIDAKESSYQKGYLLEEFKKATAFLSKSQSKSVLNPVFTERGPANVPGRTRGIAVDPTDNKRWFAATASGGVWLTEDEGVTWSNLTDTSIPNLSTSTIVISPQDPNTLYVGTGEPFGNLGAVGGAGVFKSIDGGQTWSVLSNSATFGDVGRIIINPQDKNNVVIGTTKGIYRTVNGGNNWIQTYSSSNWVQDLDADPSNFNIQYGSVRNFGMVKSTDGGLTWSTILDRADFNSNHSRFETAISPADPNTIFVSVYSSSGATVGVNTDFYVSRNKGVSFTNLKTSRSSEEANLLTGQGWYDNIIMAHPFNANVFYVGGVAVFKVTISGANFTFTSIASGYNNAEINTDVHVDQHGMTTILGNNQDFRILLANDGGLYSTSFNTDPGSSDGDWSDLVIGKNSTQFYGATKQNGADNYIAGAQDNGCWISQGNNSDKTKTYQKILGGDGFEVIWHYNKPGNFIGVSQNYGQVGRYINNVGALSNFEESGSATAPFYAKLSNADNNPDAVFAVTTTGVWRSTDFAGTWKQTLIPNGFASTYSSTMNVEVSTADPNVVWAGGAMTEDGLTSLHVSEDNGLSFTQTSSYDNPKNNHSLNISGIGVSLIERNRAYALFSSQNAAKVLKTEDLGATWTDISGFSSFSSSPTFPDVAVHSIIEMPFDKNILWVGTDIGIFETLNGGDTWALLNNFLPVAVYDMKIVNNQVVISTYGRGIWSATLNELDSYTLPTFLTEPTVTSAQKGIESNKNLVNYNVTTDDVNRVKIFIDEVEQPEVVQDFNTGIIYQYETADLSEGVHKFGIQLFDDSKNSKTLLKEYEFSVINFDEASQTAGIDQFSNADIYTTNAEFSVNNMNGTVTQPVLNNTAHPYLGNKVYTTILRRPLTITEANKNFIYEDMAIVEPFTDDLSDLDSFYDYVIIEASTDLQTWKTLDKYDSRRFPEWLTEFNKGVTASANDNLFKSQSILLTDKGFSVGETIVFRFRLVSDPAANSFGWAIKSIQGSVASIDDVVNGVKLLTVYPTISKGNFTVFGKNTLGKTKIQIIDITGKSVYKNTLDFNLKEKQPVSVNLNAGVYILQVIGNNNKKSSQKIIIE
ncbi:T9SS type A sorting domain-containing protein [Polaribacter vadi]|uniref:T9SS type A sorting domain-containing protein n=1 Tax=Polaribacter vadi TaxID=1774273 RepID=UPI0030EE665C|tara:strand:- start:21925 stop:25389 length:3465 start_codon:yes stop_codon:yes gene_type:complete